MLQKEMVSMHVQLNEVTMECNVLCEQLVEIQIKVQMLQQKIALK